MPVPSATPKPPLSAVRAWTFLGVNLFATPGLGSLMGGRIVAGRGQLCFSVTGFFLIVFWILKVSFGGMEAQLNETNAEPVSPWWWQFGAISFGIGWLWSGFTSISLLLQARREAAIVRPIPPRLDNRSKPQPPVL